MPFSRLLRHTYPSRSGKHYVMTPELIKGVENLRIDRLRAAIRDNRVSFPSQVPVFSKHDRPDLQRKIVQLYFVLGWSCNDIARRHGLVGQRVRQILNHWKQRAAQTGYVQQIPPKECLESLRRSRPVVNTPIPIPVPLNTTPQLHRSY